MVHRTRSSFVLRLAGAVLVTASLFKTHQLVASTASALESDSARWFAAGEAQLEFALGLWCLSGFYARAARIAVLTAFSLFSVIALEKVVNGEPSCGCFGAFEIPALAALCIDAALVGALLRWQPGGNLSAASPTVPWPSWRAAILVLLVPFPIAVFIAKSAPATMTESGELLGDSTVVALDPSTWRGRRLPLLRHIDVGDQLAHGSWILVFFRADCLECRSVIPRYVALAHEMANRPGVPRVALIEVPPSQQDTLPSKPGTACLRGRLDREKTWGLGVPWFLAIDDGLVSIATRSAEPLLAQPMGSGIRESQRQTPGDGSSSEGIQFPDYRRVRREAFLREIACGPLALIAVAQDLGVPLNPDEMEALLTAAGNHGTDLLQLKELAEHHGLHALGFSASTSKLREMGQHAIVHLDRVGFAAITGYTPDGLRIVYPLRPPGVIPDDLFERSFGKTGVGLLVSRRPLNAAGLGLGPAPLSEGAGEGPHLQVTRNMLSVGRIHSHEWEVSMALKNTGTQPLRIGGISCSCPCMSASVEPDTVPPGQTAILRAKGDQKPLGSFRYWITLETNEPAEPTVKIPVRGYVEQPVGFDKPAWMVRGLLPNQATTIEVPLDLSAGTQPEQVSIVLPDKAPLLAEVKAVLGGAPKLVVQWHGAAPGWHHHKLELKVRDVSSGVASPFYFTAEVLPDVEVFPAKLLIRDTELGGECSRRLTFAFRTRFDGHYSVVWSTPGAQRAFKLAPLESTETKLSLLLTPEPRDLRALANQKVEFSLVRQGAPPTKVEVFVGEASFESLPQARDVQNAK